ncbi:hypothetical protein RQP46_003424 [Phenoliferia psychrophenolica]
MRCRLKPALTTARSTGLLAAVRAPRPPAPAPTKSQAPRARAPPRPALAALHRLSERLYDPRLPRITRTDHRERLKEIRERREVVERELTSWREVCWAAHAELAGELSAHDDLRLVHSNKTVRVVAHTIRLLLLLGHHYAASELDRAFFSRDPTPPFTPFRGQRASPFDPDVHQFGDGLGIARGTIQLAWMQSLALRLLPGVYADPDGFQSLLAELKESHAAEGGISPIMVAFLVRKVDDLAARLVERPQPDRDDGALTRLDNFLLGVQGSKLAGNPYVSLALLESRIVRLEGHTHDLAAHEEPEEGAVEGNVNSVMQDVEASIRELVSRLERPANGERDGAETIEHRARTLHIALRFVVLRTRLAANSVRPGRRRDVVAESMASAAAIYGHLLGLISHSTPPAAFDAVRERQSAALYRILWIGVGVTDSAPVTDSRHSHHAHDAHLASPDDRLHESPQPNLALIELTFATLDTTLTTLSDPHFHNLDTTLDILPRYWRRLLLALSFPATRRKGRTPWPVIKRALTLLRACTVHDAARRQTPRPYDINGNIFDRLALVRHVARATLGGGPRSAQGEETVMARLKFLLETLEELESVGEVVHRRMIFDIVKSEMEDEWPGPAGRKWRKEVMKTLLGHWPEFVDHDSDPLVGLLPFWLALQSHRH